MDRTEVADAGHSRLVKKRRGDAEHGEVDHSGRAEADNAVPLVVAQERLAFLVAGGPDPVLLQRRVQVDHVRHDGRADDPDGQAQRVRAAQVRHQAASDLAVVLTADGEEHVEEAQSDQGQERDDRQLETAVAALLESQNEEGDHRGDEPGREQRYAEDEVQPDSGAHELREVSRHRDDLGLQPQHQIRPPAELSRHSSGRLRPVDSPAFEVRYWTRMAIRLAITMTHTSS